MDEIAALAAACRAHPGELTPRVALIDACRAADPAALAAHLRERGRDRTRAGYGTPLLAGRWPEFNGPISGRRVRAQAAAFGAALGWVVTRRPRAGINRAFRVPRASALAGRELRALGYPVRMFSPALVWAGLYAGARYTWRLGYRTNVKFALSYLRLPDPGAGPPPRERTPQ